jgi:hypothetical protein
VIVGIDATAIAVGDLNGDSRPDLVVSDIGSQRISVWHQLCDGTFTNVQEWSIHTNSIRSFVTLADLNADSLLDAVFDDYPVGFALGQSDGTFGNRHILDGSFFGSYCTVADFDADGRADIVVNDEHTGTRIALYFQDSALQFAGPFFVSTTRPRPSYHLATDITRDGLPDLLVTTEGCFESCGEFDPQPLQGCGCDFLLGSIDLLSNLGNRVFEEPIPMAFLPQPREVVAKDLNLDGISDLAGAMAISPRPLLFSEGDVAVALAVPQGGYQAPRFLVNEFEQFVHEGLVTFDATGDHIPDILHGNSRQIYLRVGVGDGTFQPGTRVWLAADLPRQLTAADLNGDEILDLLVNGGGLTGISIIYGTFTSSFTTSIHHDPQPTVHFLDKIFFRHALFLDLFAFGRPGLLLSAPSTDPLFVQILNDGQFAETLSLPQLHDTDFAEPLHLDRDGLPDLVVRTSRQLMLAQNRGADFVVTELLPAPPTGTPFPSAADWNGDRWQDLVVEIAEPFGSDPSKIIVYENRFGKLLECQIQSASSSDVAIRSADFDADGKDDLLAINRGSVFRLYFSRGDCSFETLEIADPTGHVDPDMGDVDGNGLMDILATRFDHDTNQLELKILYNEGSRQFSRQSYWIPNTTETSVFIADFDRDGFRDLLLLGLSDLIVLFGRPERNFSSPEHFPAGQVFAPTLVEDFNFDGNPDVLSYGTSDGVNFTYGTGSDGIDPILSLRASRTAIKVGEHVRLKASLEGGRETLVANFFLLRIDPSGTLSFRTPEHWTLTPHAYLNGFSVPPCLQIQEAQILDDPVIHSEPRGRYTYIAVLVDSQLTRILDWKEVTVSIS